MNFPWLTTAHPDPAHEIEQFKTGLAMETARYQGTLDWHNEHGFRAAIDFALLAIRGIVLVNGGAAIALLAFLANIWKAGDHRLEEIAHSAGTALAWFVAGLVAGMSCACLSYVTQVLIS